MKKGVLFLSLSAVLAAHVAAAAEPEIKAPAASKESQVEELATRAQLSPQIVEKLEPELLAKVLMQASDEQGTLVEIIVPLAFFLLSGALVAIILYADHRKNRLKWDLLRVMVERGEKIPAELLNPPRKGSDFRRGLILISGGIGLSILLAMMSKPGSWSVGVLPMLVGVAYLIAWRVERPSVSSSQ